jgi:hypothetical protein
MRINYYCIYVAEYRPDSESSLTLTLNEWRFNLSFSWVSMQFLNSWRVSACRTLLCDYSPSSYSKTALTHKRSSLLNPHSLSVSVLLEYGRMWGLFLWNLLIKTRQKRTIRSAKLLVFVHICSCCLGKRHVLNKNYNINVNWLLNL